MWRNRFFRDTNTTKCGANQTGCSGVYGFVGGEYNEQCEKSKMMNCMYN